MNNKTAKKLLFFSPPQDRSDFLGHLVEHCISQSKNINLDRAFGIHEGLDIKYCHNSFSKTLIPYFTNPYEVIRKYQEPLCNEIITREIKALSHELSDEGRGREEILADQVSTFVGNTIYSKTVKKVSYATIKKYHEKYYIHGHWLLSDIYDSRIDSNIKEYYNGPLEYGSNDFQYLEFRPKGFKYLVLIAKSRNPYTAMFVDFVDWLIDYRESYRYRYQESKYYFRDYDSSYSDGYMYIGISHLNTYDFDEEFFESAKKYFLEKERLVNGKYMIRVWEILNQQLLNDQIVWNVINTIQYEEVKEVLEKLQSCKQRAMLSTK